MHELEDKGSCLVRLDKADYKNNVKHNLESPNLYEKLNNETTEEIKGKVSNQITLMNNEGELKITTKQFVLGGAKAP